MLVIKI